MSGIRRSDAAQAGDIEAPKDVESENFSAPPGAAHNPVFLAKVIFRKVAHLLITSDEDDITQPAGIITIFRDIVVGIILGVLVISISIFLDHHNVIHLQSAHNFRNAAFNMLNDPETIATLEESSDMKFMTTADYDAWTKEVAGVAEKIESQKEILEKRTKEADEKRKEIDSIKDEYEKLKTEGNTKLGLDKYCDSCKWGNTSCEKRVQYLKDTYNMSTLGAQVGLLDQGHCKKE